ncbi:MAG: phosphodiester glycosidase family protein [Oscillospiraceae bacterium]|nr:phosphodiester glycosidase family protein [Oscillospiraceae bacterium]
MRNTHKKQKWTAAFALLLTVFTVYVALDTFVISRVYSTVGSASAAPKTTAAQSAAVVTSDTYADDNISITLTEYREYDTTIYVADVTVSSADYLKTAFAQSAYGRNVTETTSAIAQENNAILAINGDYYGARTAGWVIRNGVLYRDAADSGTDALAVMADGSFEIVAQGGGTTADELLAGGAQQVFSFGPALVTDGTIAVSEDEEVGKAKASNPRTAVGIVGELHYLFVVSDGRTSESAGLSLWQLAEFMQSLGATTAYNLDGGGSSTMVFNGEVVNNPTTNGTTIKERSVSDIVYIGY